MKDNFAGLKRASRAAYRRHRLNHTETTTDLKDGFKGPDPKPVKVKKGKGK